MSSLEPVRTKYRELEEELLELGEIHPRLLPEMVRVATAEKGGPRGRAETEDIVVFELDASRGGCHRRCAGHRHR